jgi:hypothetical protein
MYTAWGTAPGGQYENSWGVLRDACLAHGFKTVALQITQCRREQVEDMQDKGLFVVGWDEAHRVTRASFDKLGFDGFMPQVETPGQFDATVSALRDGIGKDVPKAVVTTYWGLYDEGDPRNGRRWKILAGLGVEECHVECYASESPVWADLDRMLGQGEIYGIPREVLVPVCGVYRGELPPVYSGLSAQKRVFGCYIAEPMTEMQWKAWGGVNKVDQVYYWRLTAGASVLHEERAITYAPGDDGLGRMLDWMEKNKPIIRSAKAVDLDRVLDDPH